MSLTLKVVTPTGEKEAVTCDSVHLSVQDNGQGKGGGRYGIRSGHVQALLSVAADRVEALQKGKVVLAGQCGNGFATIENNTVTLVVEQFV